MKVLEAWAAGVPVVATPAAAEGLEAEPAPGLALAEGAEQWVETLARLLTDPAAAVALAARRSRGVGAQLPPGAGAGGDPRAPRRRSRLSRRSRWRSARGGVRYPCCHGALAGRRNAVPRRARVASPAGGGARLRAHPGRRVSPVLMRSGRRSRAGGETSSGACEGRLVLRSRARASRTPSTSTSTRGTSSSPSRWPSSTTVAANRLLALAVAVLLATHRSWRWLASDGASPARSLPRR